VRRLADLRSALVALAFAALPAAVLAAPSPSPAPSSGALASPLGLTPEALLRIALDAPNHVSYVGQLQTTRWGPNTANATIQRVEHLATGQTRRTFLAPESLYGEYDVTIGVTLLQFDTRRGRVMVNERPAAAAMAAANTNIALLEQNYRSVLGPSEVVAGRPATSIWLVSRYTGERMMRIWIDNSTKFVLAKEAYHGDGSLAWRMRFDDIRFTSEIPADVFSTAIPSGFREVEGRRFADISTDLQRTLDGAGFRSVGPRYLPEGFNIVGAEVSTVKGVRSLHFLYSDGVRSLSLFENNANAAADFGTLKPTVTHFEGHDAQYVKDGPTTLLTWRERGLAFALVGDLELKELLRIATSVVP
jgi:negative regulator of sigma E activity